MASEHVPPLRGPVAHGGLSVFGRRRRPSGRPPPLPRELGSSGRFWAGVIGGLVVFLVLLVTLQIGGVFERYENAWVRWFARFRAGWLTDVARWTAAIGGEWTNRVARWAIILALVIFRRWRHLFVFLGTVLFVSWVAHTLSLAVARPRPLGVAILGSWEGFSFPSVPVTAAALTLLGVVYTVVVPGRPRQVAKWVAWGLLAALSVARVYLGQDHPADIAAGLALGVGLSMIAYRLFTPNAVFPVRYRKGRSAHLDIEGKRGTAIREALRDQLGLVVSELERFGLAGSGGSTPMRLTVEGDPPQSLFAKLYAKTHVRADRWYKLGRTILYGALEDEKAYNSVRRLVQYEDYVLRVVHEAGIRSPKSFGFVEITPEQEYVLVTEFVAGAQEIGEVEVDDEIIDEALRTIRLMWDVGVAHRDVKAANILVRKGKVHLIDWAFGELRPSPWRQAVDLANMMIVLGLRTDPDRVYRRAMEIFTPAEIAEAFAATRSVTMPSQSRAALKAERKQGRDLLARFRELAPPRKPIAIQRWSVQRIGLTLGALLAGLALLSLLLDNLRAGVL